tara:strand:- start:9 stop:383 length:375 start_codon:yes stop_codon:yes gene_type:complete
MVIFMKTIVLGASPNPDRYSYKAVQLLQDKDKDVVAMGLNKGKIGTISIVSLTAKITDVHTVSLYLNPQLQEQYLDFILSLNPKRVLFNPGTENPILATKLIQEGIAWENVCTLLLLTTNQYEP